MVVLRFNGAFTSAHLMRCRIPETPLAAKVLIGPAEMALTRTLCRQRSTAS